MNVENDEYKLAKERKRNKELPTGVEEINCKVVF
jgi:hypothetical protein